VNVGEILLGVGIGSIVVAIINFFSQRKKLSADAASVISKAATDLVAPLSARIDDLNERLERAKVQAQELTEQLESCRRSMARKDRELERLREIRTARRDLAEERALRPSGGAEGTARRRPSTTQPPPEEP
jgi:uncharacterized protein YlxW (UPF0749 family)